MPLKKADPFYLSTKWEETRRKVLKRDNYTCQECGVKCLGKKRNKPSPNVDHIIERKDRPDLALTLSNLQILCGSCHSKRTRARDPRKNAPQIGLDGYPIEEAHKL